MLADVASLILQHIASAPDVCRFAQLCKVSSTAAAHDDVWRPLALSDFRLLRAISSLLPVPGTRSYRSLYRTHWQLAFAPATGCLQWSPGAMGSHTQLELHGGVVNADDYVMSIELRNHGAILCARAFTLDEVSRPQTLELELEPKLDHIQSNRHNSHNDH